MDGEGGGPALWSGSSCVSGAVTVLRRAPPRRGGLLLVGDEGLLLPLRGAGIGVLAT